MAWLRPVKGGLGLEALGGVDRFVHNHRLRRARQRRVLHKGHQAGLADVVDEDLAGGGWSHPEETCGGLPSPAQTALLRFKAWGEEITGRDASLSAAWG